MAQNNGMKYFEASAKENRGIDEFMDEVMSQIYHNRFSSFTEQRLPTFKLRPSDVARDTSIKGKYNNKNCKC